MGHNQVQASHRNNCQTAFCAIFSGRVRLLGHISSGTAAAAAKRWQGTGFKPAGVLCFTGWLQGSRCGAAAGPSSPIPVWSGDSGCSLEISCGCWDRGDQPQWERLERCLAVTKPSWYPEKREDRGTCWVSTSAWIKSTGPALGSPGAMGLCSPMVPSPAPHLSPGLTVPHRAAGSPLALPYSGTSSPDTLDPAPPASVCLVLAPCGSGRVRSRGLSSPKPLLFCLIRAVTLAACGATSLLKTPSASCSRSLGIR